MPIEITIPNSWGGIYKGKIQKRDRMWTYVNKTFIAIPPEGYIGEDVNICYMIIREVKK